jgi:hypothetical protein
MCVDFKRKFIFAVAAISIVGIAVTGIVSLVHRGASIIRAERVDSMVTEIQRGNYYAWAQARDWWQSLTGPEKSKVTAACREYASTNQQLNWKGEKWPPQTSDRSLFRCGLDYDGHLCLPAFRNVHVAFVFAEVLTNDVWLSSPP